MNDVIQPRGAVEITVDYLDGRQEKKHVNNAVVKKAKEAHIKCLVNEINETFDFYIDRIIIGTNGTVGGVPKQVEDSRNGLFGVTVLSKAVISTINESIATQAIFTVVITFSEGNGYTLNEMALVMKNGDVYSMITMGGITKTSEMQLTLNWRISMV